MEPWRSQHFKKFALEQGGDPETVDAAVAVGRLLQSKSPASQPIFSLKHLATNAEVKYKSLRDVVERRSPEKYRVFKIQKRSLPVGSSKRYRMICVPDPQLMKAQRWIVHNILAEARTHDASVAYKAKANIVDAASLHCGCRWLIKLDLVNFFESISERAVFRVFRDMGYQPLVAFELARICTRKGDPTWARNRSHKRWRPSYGTHSTINSYSDADLLGHLPQGAPTSPMLSNIVMYDFDLAVENTAQKLGLTYTRYADDLTLSSNSKAFSREAALSSVSELYQIIRKFSFEPNLTKTKIVPPGSRKVVLGLLVDGPSPRLTKQFRNRLRLHLHHIGPNGAGAVEHAQKNQFQSVFGLRNHLEGLISFAHLVDPELAKHAWAEFENAKWL